MPKFTDRDPITVIRDLDSGETTAKPFHCVKCGKVVCEIVGGVKIILPGFHEESLEGRSGPVVVPCRGVKKVEGEKWYPCNAKYYL